MEEIKIQKVDGKTLVMLPKNVSVKDFENWLNNTPNKKELKFKELPEKWTSLDIEEE